VQQLKKLFTVSDSAGFTWQSARNLLYKSRRQKTGLNMHESDSLIIVTYAGSYEKGNSVKILRSTVGYSVSGTSYCWNSRMRPGDAE